MQRSHVIALVVLGLVLGSLIAVTTPSREAGGSWRTEPVIGLIYLDGVLVTGQASGGLLETYTGSEVVVEQLRQAASDAEIRAVVLRINSPGGTAAAAQEISTAIQRLQEVGKPVVASLADVAASGGYWIAAQCNAIIANPATLTGSIGVIMEVVNYQELYEKLGMDFETIKSGPHKDLGSKSRPMTDEERGILQSMVDDVFDQFVQAVANGRDMDYARVLALSDGRVFTGRQAQGEGLIDAQGDLDAAFDRAAELAGLQHWSVRPLARPSRWAWLFGAVHEAGEWFSLRGVPAQLWWGRQLVRLSGWE